MSTALEQPSRPGGDPDGSGGGAAATATRKPGQRTKRSTVDKLIITTMVLVPALLVLWLVWLPALGSIALSFARWNGFGGLDTIEWVGFQNYEDVTTIYPPFWPAVRHNVIWLVFLFVGPTVLGMLLAVILDREMRGSRFYQTAFYMPVVLSLALVGFIWQLFYSRDQGLLNQLFAERLYDQPIDWYGDPDINLWAVLVATAWRHTGYIMLIYLAGLKGVDHSVWVINKGRNGLEVIGALVNQNVIGEATRYGFGSALAVFMMLISSIFITIYLRTVFRQEGERR
jgi:multiple sugar transport system permease protein